MAYCPKCSGAMEQREAVCPHCGYDFPPEPDITLRRTGIAYSVWADIALMIGGFVAGTSSVVAIIYSLAMLIQGDFFALVYGPIATFFNLAMLVVFLRIQEI
jgi:hypothetical protein